MKAIIVGGGRGWGVFALSKVSNKEVVGVGKYGMMFDWGYKVKEAGVRDIMIIRGKEDMGEVVNVVGRGRDMGVCLRYGVEDEGGGIDEALG
ncbi:sugar phosphate nucleotidyltransferase, partial [Paenibacillus xylanexedens]|uniref:sugar phosphate nucleotidyltransferase n=1 Tax=Paenibacillus xylanexedens TaxID=528191 RepID=UPI0021B368CB